MKITFFILAIFTVNVTFENLNIVHANYQFEYRAFDVKLKANENQWMDLDRVKIKRKNRNETHKMYGEYELYQGIKRDIDVRGELYIKQGGEYRKTVYKFKMNLCKIIEEDKIFYPSARAIMEPEFPEKVGIRLNCMNSSYEVVTISV